MVKFKLKTKFDFDAAHRLVGYDGKCQNCHGHIWTCQIEVVGKELDEIGMLWDFTNAKKIKDLFDHKTILKNCTENVNLINLLRKENNEIYLMYSNPTAENLCKEILEALKYQNPKLKYKVTVWESPKSSCEVESEN